MGTFVSVSAFETESVEEVVSAFTGLCQRYDVKTSDGDDSSDWVGIYSAANGWVRVNWPMTFGMLPVTKELSSLLNCKAVASDIYDGDFWRFVLCDSGDVKDRFCSDRTYFGPGQELDYHWSGNPEVVASSFGIEVALVVPFFVSATTAPFVDTDDPWVFARL